MCFTILFLACPTPYFLLNILFLISVVCSFFGLNQLVQIKVRDWDLVAISSTGGGIVLFALIVLVIWITYEIQIAKKHLDQLRAIEAHVHEDGSYKLFTVDKKYTKTELRSMPKVVETTPTSSDQFAT